MNAGIYRRLVWVARLAIVNMTNVPAQGYEAALENAHAIFERKPHLIAFAEVWHQATIIGILDAAPPAYRFVNWRANSAALGYDSDVWRLEDHGYLELHGAVAGKFGVVSDERGLVWARLVHRATGRKVILGALHLAPQGTRKGRRAVIAARAARAVAKRRLRRFARRLGYPLLLAGDWNVRGEWLGNKLAGRHIDYSDTRRIDHAAGIAGTHAELELDPGHLFDMPHIDHAGGVMVTVRGMVVLSR